MLILTIELRYVIFVLLIQLYKESMPFMLVTYSYFMLNSDDTVGSAASVSWTGLFSINSVLVLVLSAV